MFHFSCTVQSSSPGGIFERRICWIVCSQVLRKPQGTEKGTLCKQDVQLQQAEEKKHFKPHISQYFPNISKYFSNISQYFSNISPIFPNMSPIFPVFPNTSKYPPSSSRPEWSRLVSQPEARSFSERCQRRSTIQISFFRFFKISFSFPTFAGANWTSSSQMWTARELMSWLKK